MTDADKLQKIREYCEKRIIELNNGFGENNLGTDFGKCILQEIDSLQKSEPEKFCELTNFGTHYCMGCGFKFWAETIPVFCRCGRKIKRIGGVI